TLTVKLLHSFRGAAAPRKSRRTELANQPTSKPANERLTASSPSLLQKQPINRQSAKLPNSGSGAAVLQANHGLARAPGQLATALDVHALTGNRLAEGQANAPRPN